MKYSTLPHDHGKLDRELILDMPNLQTFEMVADIMKMMSDSKRIWIFWLLCHCEECVINISALLEMSSSAASHHLKLLKTAGLITSRRDGKEVYYSAANTTRARILHEMVEQIIEVACPADEDKTDMETETSAEPFSKTIEELHKLLTEDLTKRYTIEELAAISHINQTTLKTTFKAMYGMSVGGYMKEYRIKKARELLSHGTMTITEVSRAVGYENPAKFTVAFRDVTGLLPKDYRKLHKK